MCKNASLTHLAGGCLDWQYFLGPLQQTLFYAVVAILGLPMQAPPHACAGCKAAAPAARRGKQTLLVMSLLTSFLELTLVRMQAVRQLLLRRGGAHKRS